MSPLLDFLLQFLSQFAAGPGGMENNLVRFGLPAFIWAGLLMVAWGRQREYHLPREKLLIWGFGLASLSAAIMTVFVSLQLLNLVERATAYAILVPLQRALSMASIIVVAGAFLHYTLNNVRLAHTYIWVGLGTTLVCLAVAFWLWPRYLSILSEEHFHLTWVAGIFQVFSTLFIVAAIILLRRKRGWLPNVVTIALLLFLAGELLFLLNNATDEKYNRILCPIGNSFPMLAIPVLGYVYIREQNIDKRRAEKDLAAYRDHLEELVIERTAEIEAVNARLKDEVYDRKHAEEALEKLSHQYEIILESAGEGICGIDQQGRFSFVNEAAARLLGYSVEELVGQACHPIWHHSKADQSPYPENLCPICNSFKNGVPGRGDDQLFWRKDSTSFPVHFVSNPTYEKGTLTGAVVVFRDITARKRAEAEIALRNANLAAQNAIAATLSRSLELETILDTALNAVLSVMKMELGLIFLWDSDLESISLRSARGSILRDLKEKPEQGCKYCEAISAEAMECMCAVVHSVDSSVSKYPDSIVEREGIKTLISVPLVSNDRSLGALTLGSMLEAPVQTPELDLLTAIGQQIGIAIENAHLYQDAEQTAEELTLLHEISTVLASTLSADRIYDQIVEQSTRLLSCQAACILAWNEEEQRIYPVSCWGFTEDEYQYIQSQASASVFVQNIIKKQESIVISDAQADSRVPAAGKKHLNVRAVIIVPIWGMKESSGSLFLIDRRSARHWRFKELVLVENFVNRAAVALMNANLAKQLEWAAALEERQRIAADMHDGLAQIVSLLGLQIEEAMELVNNDSGDEALAELANTRETVKQVSVEVRRSIASLHKTPQPRRSLQELLFDLPAQLPLENRLPVNIINNVPEPLFLPRDQEDQVLLIVQEALLNAQRHAHPQKINIILNGGEREARITIEDDGLGFESGAWWESNQHHFGMGIMHSRAARIGASLQIDSAPGKGTRVNLTLPPGDGNGRSNLGDFFQNSTFQVGKKGGEET